MPGERLRAAREHKTRELLLTAAERMFAEHGVRAVSNRQISEAAGQGNNAAVSYHFGAKEDLLRAITRRHSAPIEELRQDMLAGIGDDADLRNWIECLVRPITVHLAAAGGPTWFARFGAQMMTDPSLRPIMVEESLSSPALVKTTDGVNRCSVGMPAEVRLERSDMTRQLLVHVIADHERSLSGGSLAPRDSWQKAADGLIDALSGLWSASISVPSLSLTED
ncbi:TetR/AcrR family transcriptional regulator [Amycolatopsis sp. NPDC051061]|uniref:TetR/AcrR family transcriptional regulator n=1 Tax=Amycolatopsis sp. NPDC051061 TaxID=3155042 RepID=UPI003436C241